ncbi:ubiquitinyl hydrolase 1 [Ranunculus cassubicifolius]
MEDAVKESVMDNNPLVLVFGSFTEDELRRSLKVQPTVNVNESSPKRGLQFGSLDIETVRSVGAPTVVDVSKCVQPAVLDNKGSQIGSGKRANDVPSVSQENGSGHTPAVSFIQNKGVGEINVKTTSIVSQSEVSPLNHSVDLNSHTIESLSSSVKNVSITVNSSLNNGLVTSKDNTVKALNGSSSKDLLPRGLINSGNLCFLNATLQALLSCSPFVKLLQDLRSRSIPKLGYPMLHAFVKFISDFDLPGDFNLKKTDNTVLQTGRPLSPTMFEPILKLFTPDVPNSISGRPRQEDAQEFLSFVMDHMHDELLKLEGNSSNLGSGSKASLLSSSDDDGWETVGPKNKSAVVRTQSLVPSELSSIFGGEVRSVVKAQGNKASATVQPFLLLHLDIYPEAVRTIEDALHLLSVPEKLEGYRASAAEKGGVVSASKSVQIQKPSKVMILHLMRFGYGSQGSTKSHQM